MSEAEIPGASNDDQIPDARGEMDERNGSPETDAQLIDAPEQTAEQDMPDSENPLERGQVT